MFAAPKSLLSGYTAEREERIPWNSNPQAFPWEGKVARRPDEVEALGFQHIQKEGIVYVLSPQHELAQ